MKQINIEDSLWQSLKNIEPNELIYKGKFYETSRYGWVMHHYELYPDKLVRIEDQFIDLASVLMQRLKPSQCTGQYKFGLSFTKGPCVVHLFAENVESFNLWHDYLKRLVILPSFHKRHKIISKVANTHNYFLCYKCINGQQFHLRVVEKEPSMIKLLNKEIAILRRLSHPNVQKLLEVYEDNKQIYVLFELFLGKPIRVKNFEESEKHLAVICYKLLSALAHIHQKGIIHKDIRPDNIIILEENILNPILANFSQAQFAHKSRQQKIIQPGFMAPELFTNKPYNTKIDIFSLGIIFYMLFYNKYPFEGKDFRDTQILNEKCDIRFDANPKISHSGIELLKTMLLKDPNQRISASQALKHHWFINTKIKEPLQRDAMQVPSLSTILERTEYDISHIEGGIFLSTKLTKKIRTKSKSVDSQYFSDLPEMEFTNLSNKIQKLKEIEFIPSRISHASRIVNF